MRTKNYLGKYDENRGIVLFLIVFIIFVLLMAGIFITSNFKNSNKNEKVSSIDDMILSIEHKECNVNKFELEDNKLIIDGTLEDSLPENLISRIEEVQIVFMDKTGDRYAFDTNYLIYPDKVEFSSVDEESKKSIIELDKIEESEYFIFFRIKYDSNSSEEGFRYRYYTLTNNTENNQINYNNIDLHFDSSGKVESYLTMIFN